MRTFADYCLHTIDFIQLRLANKDFYHSTYYYNMSLSEKFLVGFVLYNKIWEIDNLTEQYTYYYQESSPYQNKEEDGYFPNCAVERPKDFSFKMNVDDSELFKSAIKNVTNHRFIPIQSGVKLKSFELVTEYRVKYPVFSYQEIQKNNIFKLEVVDDKFNLYPFFEYFIISKCEELVKTGQEGLKVKSTAFRLQVEHQGEPYDIFIKNFEFEFILTGAINQVNLKFLE